MANDAVCDLCDLRYDVIARLNQDRRVQPPDRFGKRNLNAYAETLAYEEVTISVRGEETSHLAADTPVFIPGFVGAKLVAIKDTSDEDDGQFRYYVSTNLDISVVEIMQCAEHRWNIETLTSSRTRSSALTSTNWNGRKR